MTSQLYMMYIAELPSYTDGHWSRWYCSVLQCLKSFSSSVWVRLLPTADRLDDTTTTVPMQLPRTGSAGIVMNTNNGAP